MKHTEKWEHTLVLETKEKLRYWEINQSLEKSQPRGVMGKNVSPSRLLFFVWPLCGMRNLRFPNQGSNLGGLHWESGIFTIGLPRKSLLSLYEVIIWNNFLLKKMMINHTYRFLTMCQALYIALHRHYLISSS